jgi:hypothetical protein
MKNLMILAAAGAALAVAAPASAAVVIPSPGAVQPDENVLASTSMTGLTVLGNTNQTNTSVSIASTNNENLTSTTSNGQSRFVSTDGSLDMARIFLTGGGTFTSAEFNLFNALSDTTSVSIIVDGVAQNFALTNGENFFGIQATGNERITSIAFDTNGTGVTDLRQVRLGGVSSVAAVPEPGTWAMMLLGFGGMGVAMRRKRRSAAKRLMQIA